MSWEEYFVILGSCVLTMLVCRVAPIMFLKDRSLPKRLEQALGYIPPAAFAALVANDLISPNEFAVDAWAALIPWLAAVPVVFVAVKYKSLLWCIVIGVAGFSVLLLLPI